MRNERLRALLLERGKTPDQLAEAVRVDAKTVERWITRGRLPYRRHRFEVASFLGVDEAYIWPDALGRDEVAVVSESEVVAVWWVLLFAEPRHLWCHVQRPYQGQFGPGLKRHLPPQLDGFPCLGVVASSLRDDQRLGWGRLTTTWPLGIGQRGPAPRTPGHVTGPRPVAQERSVRHLQRVTRDALESPYVVSSCIDGGCQWLCVAWRTATLMPHLVHGPRWPTHI